MTFYNYTGLCPIPGDASKIGHGQDFVQDPSYEHSCWTQSDQKVSAYIHSQRPTDVQKYDISRALSTADLLVLELDECASSLLFVRLRERVVHGEICIGLGMKLLVKTSLLGGIFCLAWPSDISASPDLCSRGTLHLCIGLDSFGGQQTFRQRTQPSWGMTVPSFSPSFNVPRSITQKGMVSRLRENRIH